MVMDTRYMYLYISDGHSTLNLAKDMGSLQGLKSLEHFVDWGLRSFCGLRAQIILWTGSLDHFVDWEEKISQNIERTLKIF